MEDVIPSTSRLSNTRGLPAKEILDFIVPELNTTCLRQALTGTKTCEQLTKVDEQGVGVLVNICLWSKSVFALSEGKLVG